jgi:hypothetical protein
MSDEQVMAFYREQFTKESFSVMWAGLAAGELKERGYDIIEKDGELDQFVKQEQKVA